MQTNIVQEILQTFTHSVPSQVLQKFFRSYMATAAHLLAPKPHVIEIFRGASLWIRDDELRRRIGRQDAIE